MTQNQVLIIGCGVSGLSCGIRLLEAGVSVLIVARSIPPNTTSDKAAAIWYPYQANPVDRVLAWARRSFEVYKELIAVSDAGVNFSEFHELFDQPTEDPWWLDAVDEFRRLESDEIPDGYCDGFAAKVPVIETPLYMPYLLSRFKQLGGSVKVLDSEMASLDAYFPEFPLMINCTGLGSGQLVDDPEVFPASNPGLKRSLSDDIGPLALSYIISRTHDCILGGTAQKNDWDEQIDAQTSATILERCRQLDPSLQSATALQHITGLRPGRSVVRLESERHPQGCVIHNYGHGGAGFTLAWGCADEVTALALEFIHSI